MKSTTIKILKGIIERIKLTEYYCRDYIIRNIVNNRGLFNQSMDLGITSFESNPEILLRNPELEGVLTIQGIWTNTQIVQIEYTVQSANQRQGCFLLRHQIQRLVC